MYEPSGDARLAAVTLWDHKVALTQAGFTEEQAMDIIKTLITSNSGGK